MYDSSEKKSGGICCDADIDSGNHYRYRIVIKNSGTVNIYGGSITPGHYESFYSAKYAKTVYKMTTGDALLNYGTAYIYGGTFTGRNGRGYCLSNGSGATMKIYDAKLYGKGGANGLYASSDSVTEVYAIETDLNKETAVENDKNITSGYPTGKSGVTESMLVGDYKITKQSDKDSVYNSSKLVIEPVLKTPPIILDSNDTQITIPVAPEQDVPDIVSFNHFTKNRIGIRRPDGVTVSGINWLYRIQRQNGYTGQWSDVTQGNVTSISWALGVSNFINKPQADVNYKILLWPSYSYNGWSHSYKTEAVGSVAVILVSGQTIVTLNPNGGTVNPTKKAVTPGTVYGALPTPRKKRIFLRRLVYGGFRRNQDRFHVNRYKLLKPHSLRPLEGDERTRFRKEPQARLVRIHLLPRRLDRDQFHGSGRGADR